MCSTSSKVLSKCSGFEIEVIHSLKAHQYMELSLSEIDQVALGLVYIYLDIFL